MSWHIHYDAWPQAYTWLIAYTYVSFTLWRYSCHAHYPKHQHNDVSDVSESPPVAMHAHKNQPRHNHNHRAAHAKQAVGADLALPSV